MADPRDARIAELEELLNAAETARQAAEEERDAFRQVLAFWDVLVADIRQQQRGGLQPLSCSMAARLV